MRLVDAADCSGSWPRVLLLLAMKEGPILQTEKATVF
jgi:hypothetical protein